MQCAAGMGSGVRAVVECGWHIASIGQVHAGDALKGSSIIIHTGIKVHGGTIFYC